MDNQRRQNIWSKFDSWVNEYGSVQPELLMDVQCELLNMQEEIEFWIRFSVRLKLELENYKNNQKPTTSISVL